MERIGHEIERTLSTRAGGQAAALAKITAVWPQVVGEAVARSAWPLRFGRDGSLHVATVSSTWAFELDRLSPEIALKLVAALGDNAPSGLRFRVGPVPEPGPLPPNSFATSRRAVDVSPEIAATADSAAAAISDDELRQTVAKAARLSLSKARADRGFW